MAEPTPETTSSSLRLVVDRAVGAEPVPGASADVGQVYPTWAVVTLRGEWTVPDTEPVSVRVEGRTDGTLRLQGSAILTAVLLRP